MLTRGYLMEKSTPTIIHNRIIDPVYPSVLADIDDEACLFDHFTFCFPDPDHVWV